MMVTHGFITDIVADHFDAVGCGHTSAERLVAGVVRAHADVIIAEARRAFSTASEAWG